MQVLTTVLLVFLESHVNHIYIITINPFEPRAPDALNTSLGLA